MPLHVHVHEEGKGVVMQPLQPLHAPHNFHAGLGTGRPQRGVRPHLSPAIPQQGMPLETTWFAQRPASLVNASSMPIFLDEQGTWMATVSRTWWAGCREEGGAGLETTKYGAAVAPDLPHGGWLGGPCNPTRQQVCAACAPRALLNSSLSTRKWRMNSTGSYSAKRRDGADMPAWGGARVRGGGGGLSIPMCSVCVSATRQQAVGGASAGGGGGICWHKMAARRALICDRQGEVSHTMGILPPSLASISAASSSWGCRSRGGEGVGAGNRVRPWPFDTSMHYDAWQRAGGREPHTLRTEPFLAAASFRPRLLNIMPQHWLDRLAG